MAGWKQQLRFGKLGLPALAVKQNEASRPIAMDVPGANAVVPCPDRLAQLIQQLGACLTSAKF